MTNLSGANLNNGAAVGPQGEGRDSPSTFPKYPAYKDSGDEWLGKVPEHWQALALSRVLAAPVTDGPHTTPEFLDDGVPFLSVDGIQDGKLYFEGCRYVSFEDHKEFSKKAAPKYNDLLMGKAASVGKIARVTENIEFSIWSPLALIRVNEGQCSPEFLEFCLKSSELQHQVLLASNSNTQLNIGMKDIPKLRIPLPALQEQTQIARFLDHETVRIDALIEEQQRLIELLKEKRQAVISHAVTKGLDPTVPMKDSGVEWLGEVPAHWVVLAIKWRARIKSGDGISPDLIESQAQEDKPHPVIGGNGVMGFTSQANVSPPLIVIGRVGALCGNVHKIHEPAWVSDNALILDFDRRSFDINYLVHVLDARNLNEISDKSAQPLITGSKVTSQYIPCPSRHEQLAIAKFLEGALSEFDQLVFEGIKGIELLKERRSALISAAVTGKIDVRGWQPPASTQAPESVKEAV